MSVPSGWAVEAGQDLVSGHGDGGGAGDAAFDFDVADFFEFVFNEAAHGSDVVAGMVALFFIHVDCRPSSSSFGSKHCVNGSAFDFGAVEAEGVGLRVG